MGEQRCSQVASFEYVKVDQSFQYNRNVFYHKSITFLKTICLFFLLNCLRTTQKKLKCI